jgi:hypothetical protein
MRRFMRVVLSINMALAVFIGFTGYVLHVGPEGRTGGAEPILGHALAAVYLGFVATLFLALRHFEREPAWLLIPVFFQFPLWIDALYELSAGTGHVPPAIIRPVLVACYVAGYVVLRRSAPDRGARATEDHHAAPARQSPAPASMA